MPAVQIYDRDTVLLGESDFYGYFEVNTKQNSNKLIFSFIGSEVADISFPQNCDYLEVILLFDANYNYNSSRKVDRDRKKRYNALPKIHLEAFKKQMFVNDKSCTSREFYYDKPILDEIRKHDKIRKKQIKEEFKLLQIGDTIKIPFGVNNKDNDRTSLNVYSSYVNGGNKCIIEGVVLDKNKKRNEYHIKYEVVSCDSCEYNSMIFDGKDMKVGEEFDANMKYTRVIVN